jgi:hypothetical protein
MLYVFLISLCKWYTSPISSPLIWSF